MTKQTESGNVVFTRTADAWPTRIFLPPATWDLGLGNACAFFAASDSSLSGLIAPRALLSYCPLIPPLCCPSPPVFFFFFKASKTPLMRWPRIASSSSSSARASPCHIPRAAWARSMAYPRRSSRNHRSNRNPNRSRIPNPKWAPSMLRSRHRQRPHRRAGRSSPPCPIASPTASPMACRARRI